MNTNIKRIAALSLAVVTSACGGPAEQSRIPTSSPSPTVPAPGASTTTGGAVAPARVFEGRYWIGNSACNYTLRLFADRQTESERAQSQRTIMNAEFHSTGTSPECNYSETNLIFRDKLFPYGTSRQCSVDAYGRYSFVYVTQPENFYLQPAALQAGLGLVLEWTIPVRSSTGANPCLVPSTSVTPDYTRPANEAPPIAFLGCDSTSDRSEGSSCLQVIGPMSTVYSRFETLTPR
jgi:hypothetical protein